MKRLLVLEDGTVFEGEAFGADLYVTGELVFTTAMTGYQEFDHGSGFLVARSSPLPFQLLAQQGSIGTILNRLRPICLAVVVQHLVEMPSNWRQQMTLDEFLKRKKPWYCRD